MDGCLGIITSGCLMHDDDNGCAVLWDSPLVGHLIRPLLRITKHMRMQACLYVTI